MGPASSRLMPRNIYASTLDSGSHFRHAVRRCRTLHKSRGASFTSRIVGWPFAGAMAAQLQASATDPIRVGNCRGRGGTDRRVSFGGLAVVCRKHPVARQLAVHAIRHHARQQTLDGDVGKRGGRRKPRDAGSVGKAAGPEAPQFQSYRICPDDLQSCRDHRVRMAAAPGFRTKHDTASRRQIGRNYALFRARPAAISTPCRRRLRNRCLS